MSASFVVAVNDASAVGEVRRRATSLAGRLGFDATDVGRVALVVTESGSNLVKHAGGGEILVHSCGNGDGAGVEILIVDRGPGIGDVEAALRDGYSAAGTPGTGLGAIRRTSSEFDIYSRRNGGTALLVVLRARSRKNGLMEPTLRVAGVSIAQPGEQVCGDDWASRTTPDGYRVILIVDGLGHGLGAAEAAQEALRLFAEDPLASPREMLDRLHRGLRATRGAAAAVAMIPPDGGQLVYAGVGNIAGAILGGERARALVSHNGILGHEVRRVQEFSYPWPAGSTLVVHTDGLTSHWELEAYPGLIRRHPALIAGILYRDFRRRHDDATVVVARPWAP